MFCLSTTDRQTDRQTERQAGRQTDRQSRGRAGRKKMKSDHAHSIQKMPQRMRRNKNEPYPREAFDLDKRNDKSPR